MNTNDFNKTFLPKIYFIILVKGYLILKIIIITFISILASFATARAYGQHRQIGNIAAHTENAKIDSSAHSIINDIKANVDRPSLRLRSGSYLTDSERAIRQLVDQLVHKGPIAIDSIKQESLVVSGNTRIWLNISLGFLLDDSIHGSLPEIAMTNPDHNIRAMAISALANYGDTADLPIIKKALYDTAFVIVEYDVDIDGKGLFKQSIYPVRMEAIDALNKFGFDVVPDTINGGYIINKKK